MEHRLTSGVNTARGMGPRGAATHAVRWAVVLAVHLAAVTGSWCVPARGQLTRSDVCGTCHRDIYRMWRASAHANAMEDAIFQDAYREAEAQDGRASRECLKCHAPALAVNGDSRLEEKITWEGVSCDICHSYASVDVSGPSPRAVLDVGPVKRGPIKNADSMAHAVAYSELHTGALVCAGCHEYVNAEGAPIITTYSEWKGSAAARSGKACQTCHMGRVRADVVDPKIKRIVGEGVNLHEMPGGHSLDQLHKALELGVEPRREGDTLVLGVTVSNKGAGHAVPTGMPGRRVILDVSVQTSKGGAFADQRIYTKTYKDAADRPITRDSAYFSRGVRFLSDSRIEADERRRETFRVSVPRAATAFVTVKLVYEHTPSGGPEGRTRLTINSENRTLPGEAPRPQ